MPTIIGAGKKESRTQASQTGNLITSFLDAFAINARSDHVLGVKASPIQSVRRRSNSGLYRICRPHGPPSSYAGFTHFDSL